MKNRPAARKSIGLGILPVALYPVEATIPVEDTSVLSGVQSGELRMDVGSNVIEIKVIV